MSTNGARAVDEKARGSGIRFCPDMRLFEENPHNPSIFSLMRAAGLEEIEILDFCVPCNPYYPTPRLHEKIARRLKDTLRYYPSHNEVIAGALAGAVGLPPEQVVVANGSNELITWLDVLFVRKGIAVPVPTFGRWIDQPKSTGKTVSLFPLLPENGYRMEPSDFVEFVSASGADVAVIVNPNNPSGAYNHRDEICEIVAALADLPLVIVDESFIDFAFADAIPTMATEVERFPNLVVLKSMGKNIGLHGLRIGYAIANPARAAIIRNALPRWNVNALAELVCFDLRDHYPEYEESRLRCIEDRIGLQAGLETIPGIKVYPSRTNFVLCEVQGELTATDVRNRLLTEHGMFVRDCGNKDGIDNRFLRLSARDPADNARLLKALAATMLEGDGERAVRVEAQRRQKLNFAIRLDPEWGSIETARELVQAWLETTYADGELSAALTMVCWELLENAMRHGEGDPGKQVILTVKAGEGEIRIGVENAVGSPDAAARLRGKIDWIHSFATPMQAYLASLEKVSQTPGARGGLGLVRVAYEGRCHLRLEESAGRVRVEATFFTDEIH